MKNAALVLLLSLLAAGCGFGSGGAGGPVSVTVSRDFGAARIAPTQNDTASHGETVMRLLQQKFTVKTRFGGGFVQEIDGVSGGEEGGKKVDWFYYVNGIEAAQGANARKLSPGDRVWWDHHQWDAAQRVPAVVGSFPEPFKSGDEGKKLPIRLVCMGDVGRSCDEVETRLNQAGVKAIARSNLEQSIGVTLRIIVGDWKHVRQDIAARQLETGPAASGVFAKPNPAGTAIALLDGSGKVQRTLGPGGGLVAATRYLDQEPTWLITGTDAVGVASAAAALTEDQLSDHFALAIEAGRGSGLPLEAP